MASTETTQRHVASYQLRDLEPQELEALVRYRAFDVFLCANRFRRASPAPAAHGHGGGRTGIHWIVIVPSRGSCAAGPPRPP